METTEEVDLREYLFVLYKRKWSILIIFLSAVLTSYLISGHMTPIYEATATVLARDEGAGGGFPLLMEFSGMGRDTLQNYVEILRSRSLLERVIDRLGLNIHSDSEEFERLRKSVSVQPVQATDVIRITVQSSDPEVATSIANTMVDVLIEQNQLTNQETARSAKEFISQQLGAAEKRLKDAEERLLEYKLTQKVVEPLEETKSQIEKVVALEKLEAEAEVGIQEVKASLARIQEELGAQAPTLVSSKTLAANPLVQQYKVRLSELETQLAGAREKYADNHPTVIALNAEIEQVRDYLENEVARVVSAETTSLNPVHQTVLQSYIEAQARLVGLNARRDALSRLVAENESIMSTFPQKELELSRLVRAQRVAEEIYIMLLKKYEETRISEAMKLANIQRLDSARIPTTPVKPRRMLNTAIAGFLGLFVGVGLAFLMEFLDTSVKTIEEVEGILGSPVIGMIPSMDKIVRRRKQGTPSAGAGLESQP